MGEIIVEEKGKKGAKRRPKKHTTRIDMTPMVDLICLLITFFMLTAAFNKPKVMVITMPEKDKTDEPKNAPKISAERTLNILLSADDKVYYYFGMIKPKEPMPELVQTDFSKDGIRKVLLTKNRDLFTKIAEYREQRLTGKNKDADTTAENKVKTFKKEDKHGPIILIKADDKAKYKDIVAIIDEMAICNIASYAVVDMVPDEIKMIQSASK